MRVVHDVQDAMQCGAARNGELISVSLCNDEEQIHIEGNPKHIVAALKEALGAIEAVLAHPPAPAAETPVQESAVEITRYWTTCEDGIHGLEPAPKSKGDWVKYKDHLAALAEARRGCYTATQVEKAMFAIMSVMSIRAPGIVEGVLARLGAPEPVERVTVMMGYSGWHLWKDGARLNTVPLPEGIAKLAAAGLRAELAALAAKEPRA